MVLRLHSLKTRTALALSSVIVAILVFNGVYMILTKQEELRKGIEQDAVSFSRLTRVPIASAFLSFYQYDFAKFREIVQGLLAMNRDVTKLLIVNERGQVLFDSAELQQVGRTLPPPAPPLLQEPERRAAASRREDTLIHGRNPDGEDTLEIIAPYNQDGSGPPLSVVYQVSYHRLNSETRHLVWATGGLTLVSIGISVLVAVALATRITRPLEELTAGAQDIARGPLRPPPRHPLQRRAADPGRELQRHDAAAQAERRAARGVEQEAGRGQRGAQGAGPHEVGPPGQREPRAPHAAHRDQGVHRLHPRAEARHHHATSRRRASWWCSATWNASPSRSTPCSTSRAWTWAGSSSTSSPSPAGRSWTRSTPPCAPSSTRSGLTLQTQIDPALPSVIADREKLSAVLENLVINAIKFTPEGGRITVSAAARRGRPAAGGGDPRGGHRHRHPSPTSSARIFNRFHQVDALQHAALRRRRPRPRHREEHPRRARLDHRGGERGGQGHASSASACPSWIEHGRRRRRPRASTTARRRGSC